MKKATIIFKYLGQVYEGSTAEGETETQAICNAILLTNNEFFRLNCYAVIDGKRIDLTNVISEALEEKQNDKSKEEQNGKRL